MILETSPCPMQTLAMEEAAHQFWDVLVVGGGPAGSLASRELARLGCRVLLVDKASFPRWKVCGSCFNRGGLATLREVGLGDLMTRLRAVPLREINLAAKGRKATLPLSGIQAISREALDAALIDAAITMGVSFLPNTSAASGEVNSNERKVILRQGTRHVETTASLVLAADGLGGRLMAAETGCAPIVDHLSRVGAGAISDQTQGMEDYAPGIITMACGRRGYVGLVRIEDGRLNIAAALDHALIKSSGGLARAVVSILAEAGLPPIRGSEELDWKGTPTLTRRLAKPATHRLMALGDASGYIEPFTGEGMAWALAQALAIAPLAAQGTRQWQPSLVGQWTMRHDSLMASHYRTCRMMARLLRHPALATFVVGLLSQFPFLGHPATQYFGSSVHAGRFVR